LGKSALRWQRAPTDQKVDEGNQKLGLAEVQFREAIKLNNPGPSAHYYLGMTLKTGDIPKLKLN
jgi:hypothetical protein